MSERPKNTAPSEHLGISGAIARKFLHSQITPLLALVGFLLGLFAVAITPREEEPQINVTFANVFIAFPGATAVEVEHLVTTPAEQVLSEIEGVKHIYSVSRPGMAVLTVDTKLAKIALRLSCACTTRCSLIRTGCRRTSAHSRPSSNPRVSTTCPSSLRHCGRRM